MEATSYFGFSTFGELLGGGGVISFPKWMIRGTDDTRTLCRSTFTARSQIHPGHWGG